MSGCERCWSDAYGPEGVWDIDKYERLLRERDCTPEQQAGPHADRCIGCGRRTMHQYTNEPMCGCLTGPTDHDAAG